MPQNPFGGRQPIGVIYNTSMNRPDAALALAELYGFEGKRESRMGSVCVVGAGLKTAIFCDMVNRFYSFGPERNGNQALAIGLADIKPLPADPPMIVPAVDRKDEKGGSRYVHSINRFADTSAAEAVLRNGVIFAAEDVIILSAPATYLAKSLDLLTVPELYKARVKRLVIVDTGAPQQDVAAVRRVLAEWPSPVFYCGPEVGTAVKFPAASIDKDFAWAPAHPVVDAYRAFEAMPYDAPSWDLAAAHYAVHPDSGFFKVSEPGTVTVSEDGRMRFAVGGAGKIQSLSVDPVKKDELLKAFVDYAAAKPVTPQGRGGRRGAADAGAAGAAGRGAASAPPAAADGKTPTTPVIKKPDK